MNTTQQNPQQTRSITADQTGGASRNSAVASQGPLPKRIGRKRKRGEDLPAEAKSCKHAVCYGLAACKYREPEEAGAMPLSSSEVSKKLSAQGTTAPAARAPRKKSRIVVLKYRQNPDQAPTRRIQNKLDGGAVFSSEAIGDFTGNIVAQSRCAGATGGGSGCRAASRRVELAANPDLKLFCDAVSGMWEQETGYPIDWTEDFRAE